MRNVGAASDHVFTRQKHEDDNTVISKMIMKVMSFVADSVHKGKATSK